MSTSTPARYIPLFSRLVGSAAANLTFPLYLDHILLTLIQYNVYRACAFNASCFGFSLDYLMLDDLSSLFIPVGSPSNSSTSSSTSSGGCKPSPLLEPSLLPPSLRPTHLQQTVPHHPYIDIFPIAGVRGSLLRAIQECGGEENFHDEEFCSDLVGPERSNCSPPPGSGSGSESLSRSASGPSPPSDPPLTTDTERFGLIF